MNYLPRNKIQSLKRQKVFAVIALFVLLSFLLPFTRGLMITLVSPIWYSQNIVSNFFRSQVGHWQREATLLEENELLKARVASLERQVTTLELVNSREQAFSEMLGRSKKSREIVATVLTHPPQSPYDVVVIDAGLDDGVVLGAKVLLPEGAYMGKVVDTFGTSAKVKLLSSGGEETPAILERGNVVVTLEGRGGGNFRIKLPREVEVVVGDRVVSADIGYSLVGVVESVEAQPTDAFKEVLVRSPANIFDIRFVKVLP